jgi:hypothetical protein
MDMVECKSSLRTQCPCDYLRTQAERNGERQSTKICHVRDGGIQLVTFTEVCLL